MRKHVVTLTERELRLILAWYDALRDGYRTPIYESLGKNLALYDRLRKQ